MKKIIGTTFIIIMGIACNSPASSDDDTPDNYITITTSNVETAGAVYIDLSISSESTVEETWQISFQMLEVENSGGYMMSNLVINPTPGGIMAALYDNQTFDEITSVPTTFSSPPYSDALVDLTSVQYGGANEMISYTGPPNHDIIINTNKILLIYSMSTHKTWKIEFTTYVVGVILIKFSEL